MSLVDVKMPPTLLTLSHLYCSGPLPAATTRNRAGLPSAAVWLTGSTSTLVGSITCTLILRVAARPICTVKEASL